MVDLSYNLIGTVNHKAKSKSGHYAAITKKANLWHCYDDHLVPTISFRFRKENKTLKELQRMATILFYCHSSTSSTSTNDHTQDCILVAAEPEPVATMTVTISPAQASEAVAVTAVAVGTLKNGYVRNVPLPRIPRIQSTNQVASVFIYRNPTNTCYSRIAWISTYSKLRCSSEGFSTIVPIVPFFTLVG